MEEKKFNVQKRCEEIHAQYGTSEMANYHILLMCDKIENRAFEAGRKSVIENVPITRTTNNELNKRWGYEFKKPCKKSGTKRK